MKFLVKDFFSKCELTWLKGQLKLNIHFKDSFTEFPVVSTRAWNKTTL